MVKHLSVSAPDPDVYMAGTRTLVNDLAMDVVDLRAGDFTDWERAFTLASAIPEDVRIEDVKMYFAVAVLTLAEAREKQRAESAELIRDELVCPCESFQKMEAIPFVDGKPDRAAQSKRHASIDHHDICFFGEWAAVIVERGPRDGQVRKKRVGQDDPPG